MKKILSLSFFILLSITMMGQKKGVIKGKVTDENNIPLPGASVLIENLNIGDISNFDGNYNILNLSEATYQLTVTYLGFKTIHKEIKIARNTVISNFILALETNQLHEVFLTGTMSVGQAKALNQQKSNLNITNVVASDQVGKFPDANIGDALKRIPGISMQNDQGEARDIIVRGLSPQLNAVTLNGDRIPSAEGDNRRVQLDLIPSDMIQAVEVSKVLTADMEADAIGGSVNLVTRSAPSKMSVALSGAYGANPIRNTPMYNASVVLAGRLFEDKLGVVMSASAQSNEYGSDNIEFKWKGDKDTPFVGQHDIRKYDVKRNRRSVALNLDYKLNDKNSLYVKSIINRRKDWENRYRVRLKGIKEISDGVYETEIRRQTKSGTHGDARLEDQKIKKISLKGEHVLWNSLAFNWKVSKSRASEDRPNERYISYKNKEVLITQDLSNLRFPELIPVENEVYNNPGAYKLKEISEETKSTVEKNTGFKWDLKIPLINTGHYKNKLKIGFKYKKKYKNRNNSYNEYEPIEGMDLMSDVPFNNQTRTNFLPGSKYKSGFFVDKSYLGSLELSDYKQFVKTSVLEEFVPVNYSADETVNAAYLMLNQKFGKNLMVSAGLRVEKTKINYTGYRIDIEKATSLADVETLKATTDYRNILPSIILKYDFSKNKILRFAYTNTIARPNYYDLVPYQSINSEDLEFEEGNPALKATKSMNLDIMYEHYFSSVGILSMGAFYKKLDNWIYDYRSDNYVDNAFKGEVFEYKQPRNGREAQLYGFEFALQRKLNFLPGFFRNLNVYLNYTYTHSKTDGIEGRGDVALAGAVDNMFNASLAYEKGGFSLRGSLNYAGDYIDEYGDTSFKDSYYDKQLFLDVNASYKISEGLYLFTEFKNLTNQELRYYQGVSSQTMQAEYYSFNWNIGVKYNF